MVTENYLNHPTFGLLFRVCLLGEEQELFATLYAHRLFFLVSASQSGITFEPVSRDDAKQRADQRLRMIRRQGDQVTYDQMMKAYKQAF